MTRKRRNPPKPQPALAPEAREAKQTELMTAEPEEIVKRSSAEELNNPEPETLQEEPASPAPEEAPMDNDSFWMSPAMLYDVYGYDEVKVEEMRQMEPGLFRNGRTTEALLGMFFERHPGFEAREV